jgi:peptidylprolyl isomerase
MSIRNVLVTSFFTVAALAIVAWPCTLPAQEAESSSTATLETSSSRSISPAATSETLEFVHPARRTDSGSSITLPTGLVLKDITLGTGEEATTGKKCLVHYVMWINNSSEVHQSSRNEFVPKPFQVTLGNAQTIAGFDIALQGMHVGGRRIVSIPPALAYGATQNGTVPPNSTLHYDLELVDIKKAAEDGRPSLDPTATTAPL